MLIELSIISDNGIINDQPYASSSSTHQGQQGNRVVYSNSRARFDPRNRNRYDPRYSVPVTDYRPHNVASRYPGSANRGRVQYYPHRPHQVPISSRADHSQTHRTGYSQGQRTGQPNDPRTQDSRNRHSQDSRTSHTQDSRTSHTQDPRTSHTQDSRTSHTQDPRTSYTQDSRSSHTQDSRIHHSQGSRRPITSGSGSSVAERPRVSDPRANIPRRPPVPRPQRPNVYPSGRYQPIRPAVLQQPWSSSQGETNANRIDSSRRPPVSGGLHPSQHSGDDESSEEDSLEEIIEQSFLDSITHLAAEVEFPKFNFKKPPSKNCNCISKMFI